MKIKRHFLTMIVIALILSSCSSKIMYTKSVGFVDYSTYLDKGVFLTESNSVNFDYDAIGSITVVVYSGNVVVSQEEQIEESDIYGKRTTIQNKTGWKDANPEEALKEAVLQVTKQGGNGLINIKITPITDVENSKRVRSGFLVTGMSIKRK